MAQNNEDNILTDDAEDSEEDYATYRIVIVDQDRGMALALHAIYTDSFEVYEDFEIDLTPTVDPKESWKHLHWMLLLFSSCVLGCLTNSIHIFILVDQHLHRGGNVYLRLFRTVDLMVSGVILPISVIVLLTDEDHRLASETGQWLLIQFSKVIIVIFSLLLIIEAF